MIKLKRIYETPRREDGLRVLVDRLWPRRISKEKGRIDGKGKPVTLLYAAKDPIHNNAVVLEEILRSQAVRQKV